MQMMLYILYYVCLPACQCVHECVCHLLIITIILVYVPLPLTDFPLGVQFTVPKASRFGCISTRKYPDEEVRGDPGDISGVVSIKTHIFW